MFFDIIVLAIMVITMVSGFRKGFVYSFVHTLGWVGALIAGFAGAHWFKEFLKTSTNMDENIYAGLLERLSGSFDATVSSADTLPLIIGDKIDTAADKATEVMSGSFTELIMICISFIIILAVIKLLCFAVTMLLSRKSNKGFIGFFDGLLGLISGMIKGLILVFLFLMLLMPALNLMSPASTEIALESLDNSYIALTLYDANFLMLVIENCI